MLPKPNFDGFGQANLVKVLDGEFWITRTENSYHVFYNECAHMGGTLETTKNSLICRHHGWSYEFDGRNQNLNGPRLREVKVESETETHLQVSLLNRLKKLEAGPLLSPLDLKIHSHATIELVYRYRSIVFDPWLDGPAYYGSWSLYPEPLISGSDLKVNGIVITHPHPDHFHLPTLERINKSTPIFYPKFPSQIIEKGLIELGFKNLQPQFFDDEFFISDYFKLKFLRPRSMWEDSATLTQIWDEKKMRFNWLNLVDAGSVVDEFSLSNLDLLTSAFDQGASGYPLTWQHLSETRKIKLLTEQKKSTQKILVHKAQTLKPKYFLPFAGHWRLGLPEHEDYAQKIPHTSFEELSEQFIQNETERKFLGVHPGQRVQFPSTRIFENDKPLKDEKSIHRNEYNLNYSTKTLLTSQEISNFNSRMNLLVNKSEAFGVENVDFVVKNTEDIEINNYCFRSSTSLNAPVIKITVKVPSGILRLFSQGKANWDHIAIGYWGLWYREPDVYPSNFMRLLQAGEVTPDNINKIVGSDEINLILSKTVGDLIEHDPTRMSYLLNRLGLPCISCTHSNAETLSQALQIHGLDIESSTWILREIASIAS